MITRKRFYAALADLDDSIYALGLRIEDLEKKVGKLEKKIIPPSAGAEKPKRGRPRKNS